MILPTKVRHRAIMEPASAPVISGDAYFAAMSRRAVDRAARRAFTDLAMQITPPGGRLFDFGCGPGIDAKVYAQLGFKVGVYDSDQQMCEALQRFCCAEIASGSVMPSDAATYAEFVRGRGDSADCGWDTIVANFAPLNLIADAEELFAKFAAMLAPRGHVLVSVLNPYFTGDLRYGWWWRNLPNMLLHGQYATGEGRAVYRRSPGALRRSAGSDFRLRRTMRGLPPPARPWMPRALQLCSGQYLFLLFDRA
jgi:SAM-dependent methyltransferase